MKQSMGVSVAVDILRAIMFGVAALICTGWFHAGGLLLIIGVGLIGSLLCTLVGVLLLGVAAGSVLKSQNEKKG